jgi:hypothetical protein
VDPVTEIFKKQRLDADGTSKNFEDEEPPDTIIIAYNRLSSFEYVDSLS